jgi:hypothetical protein
LNQKSSGVSSNVAIAMIAFCGSVTIASLVTAIMLGNKVATISSAVVEPTTVIVNTGAQLFATEKPPAGDNICEGTKVPIAEIDCITDALNGVKPQSGGNVTQGFKGDLVVDHEPIKTPYFQNDMCPVNVHWHLGTEHLSVGEFDETGMGPHTYATDADNADDAHRALSGEVRGGFRCHHYDASDMKFIKPYEWQHCIGMEVGETYEVHWPHSAAGACGTPNQFQTPFYDGVFCNVEALGDFSRLPELVGVQSQVFTIVNDESFYYPDLMRGMIVDGDMGADVAKYTGSTTGTSRDNEICSGYSPITWQVDRKCHMVSASTFDKICADMKSQRDDMSDDLYAHGSRELVDSAYVADNHADRALRGSN